MAANKVLIHAPFLPKGGVFNAEARDSYFQPFIYLRERLRSLDYALEMSDDYSVRDCAWVWFFDAVSIGPEQGLAWWKKLYKTVMETPQPRNLYRECLAEGMQGRIVLFLWEAPATGSANWNLELHKLFPLIFTWNDKYVDGRKYIKFHWPQTDQFPIVPKIPLMGRKLLVNISMNKSASHPQELYSARRASIRHFERTQPNNFDLYGVGWNRPTNLWEKVLPFTRIVYSSYRGTVQNKWDVLPCYRFSLCYENIRDEPGWVTEKIFDCMRARCVPIYWGAPNITDYVDAEAFIDRRRFRSDADLEAYLLGITEQEYERYQEAMQDYLRSERFAKFLPPAFADTIIGALGLADGAGRTN